MNDLTPSEVAARDIEAATFVASLVKGLDWSDMPLLVDHANYLKHRSKE